MSIKGNIDDTTPFYDCVMKYSGKCSFCGTHFPVGFKCLARKVNQQWNFKCPVLCDKFSSPKDPLKGGVKFHSFSAKKGTVCYNCGKNILSGTNVEGHPDSACKTGWKIRCVGGNCVKPLPIINTVTKSEDSDLSDNEEEEFEIVEKYEYDDGSPDKKSALQRAMEIVDELDGDLSGSESESDEEEEEDDEDVIVADSSEEDDDDSGDNEDEEEDLHVGQLYCYDCCAWFSKDSFSAAQKKVSDEERGRFCLRHTSTSAFGSTYAKGARAIGVRMGVSPGIKSASKVVQQSEPPDSSAAKSRAMSAAKKAVRHIDERDEEEEDEEDDEDDMFERHVVTPRGAKRAAKTSSSAQKGRKVRRIASSDDDDDDDEGATNVPQKRSKAVQEEEEDCWSDEEPQPRRTTTAAISTRGTNSSAGEDVNITTASTRSSSTVQPAVTKNSTTSKENSASKTTNNSTDKVGDSSGSSNSSSSSVMKRQRVINLCEEGQETEEVFEVAVEVIHLGGSPLAASTGPPVSTSSSTINNDRNRTVRSPVRKGRLVVLDEEEEF